MKKKSKFLNLSAKLAFCLVAACTFLFTSCYEKEDLLDTPTPGTPTVTKYIIKGTVKDAESGAKLAGAKVVLSGPAEATATTDTEGTYKMEVTQTGGYSINISKEDYLTATSNITVVEAQQGTTESSYIVDASLVKVGEAPQDPTYKTVEYTIAASFVNAHTGAALDVEYQVNDEAVQTGTSMPARKVAPGSYTIKASKTNYYNSYATIVVAYALIPGQPEPIETIAYNTTVALTPVSTTPDPEAAKYYVTGNVTNAQTGAAVNATSIKLTGTGLSKSATGNAYKFELTEAEATSGTLKLQVEATDFQNYEYSFSVEKVAAGSVSNTVMNAPMAPKAQPEQVYAKNVSYKITATVIDGTTGNAVNVNYNLFDAKGSSVKNGTSVSSFEYTTQTTGKYTVVSVADKYFTNTTVIEVPETKIPVEAGHENDPVTVVVLAVVTMIPDNTPQADAVYYVEGNIKDASNGSALPATVTLYKGKDKIADIANASYYKFDVDKATAENGTFTITVTAGNEYYAFSSNFTFPKGTSNSTVKEVVNATLAKINNQPVEGIGGTVSTIIGDKGATLSLVSTIKDGTSETQETTSIIIPDNAVNEPTAISISQLVATQEAEVASRVFEGLPSGLQFNSPLKFVFNDPFNGELTGMKIAYYNEENNSWNYEGDVTTDKSAYTAEVKHFSKFKFAFESSIESAKDKNTQIIAFPIFNNRDEAKTVPYSIAYKGGLVYDGTTVAQAITDKGIEGKAADYLNSKIVNFIKSNNLNRVPGTVPTDEKAEGFLTIDPLTQVNNLIFTLNYVRTVYKVTVIYKGTTTVIEVPVIDYNGHTLSIDQESIGHLHKHAHGHGSDANAGGGIVVAE